MSTSKHDSTTETDTPRDQAIRLGEQTRTADQVDLDLNRILPGRAAIFGKSGSGKSNSIGTVTERLLEQNLAFLIVDADGEHYALKEAYEVLHIGATEDCDYQLFSDEFDQEVAQRFAQLVLEENVPIVLDVSGIIDTADQQRIVHGVAKALFNAQKDSANPRPTPLIVEEAHEYIPQQGAMALIWHTSWRCCGTPRGWGIDRRSSRRRSMSDSDPPDSGVDLETCPYCGVRGLPERIAIHDCQATCPHGRPWCPGPDAPLDGVLPCHECFLVGNPDVVSSE